MSGHNVKVNVQRVEQLPRGRIKVKIAETGLRLSSMSHAGRLYETTTRLGRGRYIMRDAGPAMEQKQNRGLK